MLRLVCVGDSLAQGVRSGSVGDTAWSFPAILARSLGAEDFRTPDFSGQGGLPLNLELLIRTMESRFGEQINFWEIPSALLNLQSFMDRVEDYWEQGDGTKLSATGPLHHNLAVWGSEVADLFLVTGQLCRSGINVPRNNLTNQLVESAFYRTALRTLNPSLANTLMDGSQLVQARRLAKENGGIENLIIEVGGNNCLKCMIELTVTDSSDDDLAKRRNQRSSTLWTPEHFREDFLRLAELVDDIQAQNVFVATVPPVTVFPVARGVNVGDNTPDSKGYFDHYTHFWVWDGDFKAKPSDYKSLTREEVKLIDSRVDSYNQVIREIAQDKGWVVVELAESLEKMAFRRHSGQPTYQFPPGLVQAWRNNTATASRINSNEKPICDTRYFGVFPNEETAERKYRGGFFSLDGIHPTVVGSGIVAHEFHQALQTKGVESLQPLDWKAILEHDSLNTAPPKSIQSLQTLLGQMNRVLPLHQLVKMVSHGIS